MKEIGIMEVGGFRLGHAQNGQAATGCTVLLCDRMSPAGLDVRGGGPASRESQLLSPLASAEAINAVLLSGGSAFGLDAAGGVQRYLEERDIGFDVGVGKVPLVCQSCLFDLSVGRKDVRPDAAMAYAACEAASYDAPAQGNVGAGTGCSVGKYRGMARAMKAGFGAFALQAGPLKVGALVAVNALGDIYDRDGRQIAGLLGEDGNSLSNTLEELFADVSVPGNLYAANTTLGVVVTNAKLAKAQLCKVAGMAHNGFARAIRPVHTNADGDSIYALSLGDVPGDVNVVGALAARAMEEAIVRAVRAAEPAYGLKAVRELAQGI
ncbi:MAG: P1 family peptidase [Eubacteriales bacterium]|nr:P1 family peptidase [Eubacteriales bacterium]